nr:DUF1566 domain-containing protein [Vibrio pectenicida]
MSNKWTYLNESGDLVENREQAACARNQVTGDIWQLFDKRDDTRWVDYSDLTKRLEKQNLDQVCGFYNWRLPSINELTSLLPIMRDVFIYNDVKDIFGPAIREKYFTDFTSENDYTSLDFIEGKHTSKTQSKWLTKDKYLYRFIAK